MQSAILPLMLASLIVPAAAVGAPHTDGERRCGERTRIVALLENHYGEARRAISVIEGQGIVELHASDATGHWTLTLTRPEGGTCLVASGQGYVPDGTPPLAPDMAL
jgi:hypothetical protein